MSKKETKEMKSSEEKSLSEEYMGEEPKYRSPNIPRKSRKEK